MKPQRRYGGFLIERTREQLTKAIKIAEEDTPRPVDAQKAKEFAERMAAIRESVEAWMRNIIENLTNAFNTAPKPA